MSESKKDLQVRVDDDLPDSDTLAASRRRTWVNLTESLLATVGVVAVAGLTSLLYHSVVIVGWSWNLILVPLLLVGILFNLTTVLISRLHRPSPEVERLKAKMISAYATAMEASALKPRVLRSEPHIDRRPT